VSREPIFDVAHLAHVEMLTPCLEESARFFIDVMGMSETCREDDSVYLRGWDDYEHHSLQLTASPQPGLGHYAFRASSPRALQRRVTALEKAGYGKGWKEDSIGHGPAYCFTDPDDHNLEIYYETEWYEPPEPLRPALKNQASRYSDHAIGLRRIDHINLLAADVRATRIFMEELLGMRLTEQIIFDDGSEKASWVTATNKSYDVAIAEDWTGTKGRLHHVTYAVDSREAILRAADICLEHNVFMETGPHKHAIQQTFFLYVYEPGGNRFEIANAGARLILAPDWKPIIWSEEERKKGQAWGLATIPSFHEHGTPPVEGSRAESDA
jgi:catechol 2,3-dioxygenase